MAAILDTNIVLYHLAGVPQAVRLVADLAPNGIAISIVTYMEAYQSIFHSTDPAGAEVQLDAFLGSVPTLPFAPATVRRCARLREQLSRERKRVRQRALDLTIAATAIEHNLTLVTRNREDFEDIPHLRTLFYEP